MPKKAMRKSATSESNKDVEPKLALGPVANTSHGDLLKQILGRAEWRLCGSTCLKRNQLKAIDSF